MVDNNCLNMKYRKRRLTMAEELTLEKFEEAYNIIKKVVLPTKLVESEYYSNLTGNKVFFKPENMQLTGAYKIRGAYYTRLVRCQRKQDRRDLLQLLPVIMHRVLHMQQKHMG
mgnify:CR=1 FL=1